MRRTNGLREAELRECGLGRRRPYSNLASPIDCLKIFEAAQGRVVSGDDDERLSRGIEGM